LAGLRGAFIQPLDVQLAPSLRERMREMGFLPPGATLDAPQSGRALAAPRIVGSPRATPTIQ
jgi:hypothetical protein